MDISLCVSYPYLNRKFTKRVGISASFADFKGFKFFVFQNKEAKWIVTEEFTGHLIAEGEFLNEVLDLAHGKLKDAGENRIWQAIFKVLSIIMDNLLEDAWEEIPE